MPGRLTRLNTLNTDRTNEIPRPRLKPRGLPPALEPHGVWAATNPADAALFGNDLLGTHRIHLDGSNPDDFEARFHGVLIRDVTFGYLNFGTKVRIEAHRLPDNQLIIVPVDGSSLASLGDCQVETSPVMAVIPPPSGSMTLECSDDAAHLVVRITRDALETHLSRLLGRTVDRAIDFDPAFDLTSGTASRWNFAVQILHAELYESDSLLHRAAGLGSVEEFLMSALLYCQASAYGEQLMATKKPTSVSVQRSIEFIDQNLARPITVSEVATAAGVSVRTLQNQFSADLDQTPTSFIRNQRLERTRSELADSSASMGTTVTDVATRWGFTHLGRFASTYRARFGESPSQTLKN